MCEAARAGGDGRIKIKRNVGQGGGTGAAICIKAALADPGPHLADSRLIASARRGPKAGDPFEQRASGAKAPWSAPTV